MVTLAQLAAQLQAARTVAPSVPAPVVAETTAPKPKTVAEVLAQLAARHVKPKALHDAVTLAPVVPLDVVPLDVVPETQAPEGAKILGILKALPEQCNNTVHTAMETYFRDKDTHIALGQNFWTMNEKQLAIIGMIALGESLNVLGSAGVGKTTAIRIGASERQRLLNLRKQNAYPECYYRHDGPQTENAYVTACAFTRQATGVLRRKMETGVHCATIHKMLGFAPVIEQFWDAEQGIEVTKRVFRPAYHKENPFPHTLKGIIIDEVSMLGQSLEDCITAALPIGRNVQRVKVGDFGQLAPVQDRSAMMLALADGEIPTIELTHIYRTQKGPVLDIAYHCRNGEVSKLTDQRLRDLSDLHPTEFVFKLNQINGKEPSTLGGALARVISYITKALETGDLDMERGDMVLCPHNERFGVKELNKAIAEFYDRRDNRVVYHIIAGFMNQYIAVGDKIRVSNESVFVTAVVPNSMYSGRMPQPASSQLDRDGHLIGQAKAEAEEIETGGFEAVKIGMSLFDDFEGDGNDAMSLEEANALIEAEEEASGMPDGEEKEDKGRKFQASHRIMYRYPHQTEENTSPERFAGQYISTASEMNEEKAGLLNYASTVHKAQGSEGHHVLIALHSSHASTLRRETLYTAITRAQKKVTILTSGNLVGQAAQRTSFPGVDWKSKAKNYVLACEALDKLPKKPKKAKPSADKLRGDLEDKLNSLLFG